MALARSETASRGSPPGPGGLSTSDADADADAGCLLGTAAAAAADGCRRIGANRPRRWQGGSVHVDEEADSNRRRIVADSRDCC